MWKRATSVSEHFHQGTLSWRLREGSLVSEQCGTHSGWGLAGLRSALCIHLSPAAFRDSRIQLLVPLSVDPRLWEGRGWGKCGAE